MEPGSIPWSCSLSACLAPSTRDLKPKLEENLDSRELRRDRCEAHEAEVRANTVKLPLIVPLNARNRRDAQEIGVMVGQDRREGGGEKWGPLA